MGQAERWIAGWLLDADDRARLLERFPPAYPDVIAHHVTLSAGTSRATPLPVETAGAVLGCSDDGEGVQALVLSIGGTAARTDGSTYHITWSIDRGRGRRAVESNAVIARLRWRELAEPLHVRLEPAHFRLEPGIL